MNRVRSLLPLAALALAFASAAAADDVAEVTNFGDALVFTPAVEAAEYVLTVTGPCDYHYSARVDKGDLVFRLDETTIDGDYRFQVVAVPVIDPGIVDALQDARQTGDDGRVRELCRAGKLPGEPLDQSAGFHVSRGEIIFDPGAFEKSATAAPEGIAFRSEQQGPGGQAIPLKDQVIPDDLIVQQSLCVGFDCVNGESFGYDTIRLKENNLRIKFEDTSSGTYPTRDWQLTANDSASGGASKFSIEDITGARVPFTVVAGAPNNTWFLDSTGRAGNRTSTPVLDIHVSTSNTPAMRLEQTSSGGFTAQTWDIAGNEANFFVRDVTGGSRLPFRIRPGAPTSAIDISNDGDVGFGTVSPDASVDIEEDVASPTQPMLRLHNIGGPPRLEQTNGAAGHTWRQTVTGAGAYNVDDTLDGIIELSLAQNGNLTISGSIITTNCPTGCGPDYVFADDYDLLSLDELSEFIAQNRHLPNVQPAKEMETVGIDMTKLQLSMLEKIEELTLYTLDQHRTINSQGQMIEVQSSMIEELRLQLAELKARIGQ